MDETNQLALIIEQTTGRKYTQEEIVALQQLLQSDDNPLASGPQSVAIGGSVQSAQVSTGDHNYNIYGTDAIKALLPILERKRFNSGVGDEVPNEGKTPKSGVGRLSTSKSNQDLQILLNYIQTLRDALTLQYRIFDVNSLIKPSQCEDLINMLNKCQTWLRPYFTSLEDLSPDGRLAIIFLLRRIGNEGEKLAEQVEIFKVNCRQESPALLNKQTLIREKLKDLGSICESLLKVLI